MKERKTAKEADDMGPQKNGKRRRLNRTYIEVIGRSIINVKSVSNLFIPKLQSSWKVGQSLL